MKLKSMCALVAILGSAFLTSAKENPWSYNYSAGARSFPLGAGAGGSIAYNRLLYGKNSDDNVVYGYLRPVIGIGSSGVVNKGSLKLELSPISPLVFSTSSQQIGSYTALETIDCQQTDCYHRLQKQVSSVALVFGVLPWFGKIEKTVEEQSSSATNTFADPDSNLVGGIGGKDSLQGTEITTGLVLNYQWTAGLQWSWAKFKNSNAANNIQSIFAQKTSGQRSLISGFGFYESSHTEKSHSPLFFFSGVLENH